MARWLVQFGYDGTGFYGWASQPGLRTVEGVLAGGLRRRGVVLTSESGSVPVASRTDRGVSARANALVLSSGLTSPQLLRLLNGISPEMFFTAAAPVSAAFRVRSASRRTYRYFEPGPVLDPARWERAAARFTGRLDVRSFGRGIPPSSPCWRVVESVVVNADEGGLWVEIRAPAFVWGMVRKIVGALRGVDRGRLSLAQLERAIRGEERLNLPLAEPEGLVLWEVEYPFRWESHWSGPNRHQADFLHAARRDLRTRQRVLSALADGQDAGGGASRGPLEAGHRTRVLRGR
jgi:tRNA pseudouridine38-40 synthase